ncbi:unnamed protein product [Rotaria socialis]|uniref:Uncharacterized protein n=1 Tax=Rotaria socialis TaxID=392032 RepID=A0A820LZC3_9BILA|nr:unnamed protein product [Rotaria socialis]CAF3397177.1 unnamed protein product [Rotaria socialis]CAF3398680.1 unnamed protein product [Rotaria socialis]CAF3457298.1 unnamed protein product [Rotaria socialis]CAF3737242.1 unnamed protein product [Rotaria socialis]
MLKAHQSFLLILLTIIATKSYAISSCIPNTPCQCYLTQYSLKLLNCSYALSDLLIPDLKIPQNITRIIATNALIRWPSQLCKYANIQILDLSGSYFNFQFIDLSCLTHLIHLNLSNTQLHEIPHFKNDVSNHLQILDLSNNHLKTIDGIYFQSLNNLISLFLQNNPIESIVHLEVLFNLANIESINLISSNLDLTLKQPLTLNQWSDIVRTWNNTSKSFSIRMKNIPLQTIIPAADKFQTISIDTMKIILKTLINSTFMTMYNTPKCDCSNLRTYQRMFSFVDHQRKYSSSLFQSTTCLMSDRITHARLFDRRTYIDLRCPLLGRMSFFPLLASSSTSSHYALVPFVVFCLFLLWIEKKF